MSNTGEGEPGITLASPPGVFPVAGYHHASLAGGMIHVAGQVARDESGNWVGGEDAGAQAVQIYRNIGRILAHMGADPENVVKIMVYMTDRENWEGVAQARRDFFGDHRPPHTGLIVAGLGGPKVKIEIEVTAWLPPIRSADNS
ncbi:RidA family protein [Roseicitreum antarcticum]|nr:RidA family protein [Roseicitreum antarcticum]